MSGDRVLVDQYKSSVKYCIPSTKEVKGLTNVDRRNCLCLSFQLLGVDSESTVTHC